MREVGQFSQLVGTARNGGEKMVGGVVRPVARPTTRYDNYIGLRRGLIGPRGRRSPRIALADSQGILLSSHEPRCEGREKDPIILCFKVIVHRGE